MTTNIQVFPGRFESAHRQGYFNRPTLVFSSPKSRQFNVNSLHLCSASQLTTQKVCKQEATHIRLHDDPPAEPIMSYCMSDF